MNFRFITGVICVNLTRLRASLPLTNRFHTLLALFWTLLALAMLPCTTPTYNFLLPSTSRTLLTLSCFPPVRALALTELFEWLKNHLLVKNRLLCVWKHSYRSTSTDCHRSLISPTVALPAEVNPAASIVFPKTLSSYLFTHQRQSRSVTSKCIPLGLQIQTLISGGTRLFVAPGRFEH